MDWEYERIVEEYTRYAGTKTRPFDKLYIETWDEGPLRWMARSHANVRRITFLRYSPATPVPVFDILRESPIRSSRVTTRLRS